jgi:hypothetical protein
VSTWLLKAEKVSVCFARGSLRNEKIADMQIRSSEIDGYLNKLEEGLKLSEEENISLINEIKDIFRETC